MLQYIATVRAGFWAAAFPETHEASCHRLGAPGLDSMLHDRVYVGVILGSGIVENNMEATMS